MYDFQVQKKYIFMILNYTGTIIHLKFTVIIVIGVANLSEFESVLICSSEQRFVMTPKRFPVQERHQESTSSLHCLPV